MTPRERTTFHNLLKLAAESPFAGERQNALAAAERLAGRYGMTLDEAAAAPAAEPGTQRAAWAEPGPAAPETPPQARRWARDFASAVHLHDSFTQADKERRARAMRAARDRGLDRGLEGNGTRRRSGSALHRRGTRRMNPKRFAKTLLQETRLPFREIAALTGLSVHAVVALKLQMRPGSSGN